MITKMYKCPKCGYDMWYKYSVLMDSEKQKSRYVKITNVRTISTSDYLHGTDWDVELTCPKCKTKWVTSDSSY